MIRKIEIDKFKGIKEFKIDNLNKINVFVGNNNSNKTSFIESIFIGLEGHYTGIFTILSQRKMQPSVENIVTLFSNLNLNNPFKIKLFYDKKKIITSTFKAFQENKNISFNEEIESVQELKEMNGVAFKLTQQNNKAKKNLEAIYSLRNNKNKNGQLETNINIEVKNVDKNLVNTNKGTAYYISPKIGVDSNIPRQVKELILTKNKSKLLKELKNFDSTIQDIMVDGKKIYFDVEGTEKFIPIQSMGAGLITVLDIIITFLLSKENVVLIDELEIGLHHKSLKKIIKFILEKMNEQKNIQLFITTHSIEVLNTFIELIEDKKDLTAYRLEKENNKLEAIEYSDDLYETLNEGWEVR